MEAIFTKLNQFEKQLEQKKQQESVISQLNMKLQTGENLSNEEYQHLYELMIILKNCLDQEHERLKKLYLDLKKRERLNKDVFQETQKELVKVNNPCFQQNLIPLCPAYVIYRIYTTDWSQLTITMPGF